MSQTYEEEKTSRLPVVQSKELHDIPLSNDGNSVRQSENWEPGFWKRFPWMGFGCLTAAILITVAEIIVLVMSDGISASEWSVKGRVVAPNVVLSVLNSLAGICFAIAVAQGIAISWWRKAMQGATIKDLHNTWSFGSSISAIVLNLKYFNIAALAAVVTKLTIIDGVLFQRSTTTYSALGLPHEFELTTFPAKFIPYTARLNSFGNDTDFFTYPFTYDLQTWLDSASENIWYSFGFTDCEGTCGINATNPGYIANCEWTEEYVDYFAESALGEKTNSSEIKQTDLMSVDFTLNFATDAKNYTWIGVDMMNYIPQNLTAGNETQRCPATVYKTTCELRQAMINYPVYVQYSDQPTKGHKGPISQVDVHLGILNETDGTRQDIQNMNYTTGQIPGFEKIADIPAQTGKPGPLEYVANGGIYQAMKDRYQTRAWLNTKGNNVSEGWSVSSERQFASRLANNENPSNNDNKCPYQFDDPMELLMRGLNMLTFITTDDIYNRAAWTDSAASYDEDTYWDDSAVMEPAIQYRTEVHYSTNYHFMFGALASTLFCACLVLPVYWGFWELGRKVSLNPIEIANAFNAPMLGGVGSRSGHADDIVKVAGKRQVVYGQFLDEENGAARRFVAPGRGGL